MRLDTFGALRRHRNFRVFWTGAAVSNVGNWMQVLAQGWLVYQLTGSALLLGAVAFLNGLPVLVLSLVGGIYLLSSDADGFLVEEVQEDNRTFAAFASLGGGITAAGVLAALGGILDLLLSRDG